MKKGSEISHLLAESRATDTTNHNSLHSFTNTSQTELGCQMFTDNATHSYSLMTMAPYTLFFFFHTVVQ
jgi:hypothetical protein